MLGSSTGKTGPDQRPCECDVCKVLTGDIGLKKKDILVVFTACMPENPVPPCVAIYQLGKPPLVLRPKLVNKDTYCGLIYTDLMQHALNTYFFGI